MAKVNAMAAAEKAIVAEAKDLLVGAKIKSVRYLTKAEADEQGWYRRPIRIELDNGVVLYPSTDDEGNDAGALFGSFSDGTGPVNLCFGVF